jgi:hypothetical protein
MDIFNGYDLMRLADQRGGTRICNSCQPTAACLRPSATQSG